MDSRGESSRGATPTLLNGATPPALQPQRTSSATNKRPAVLDLSEQALGNPTATRGQVERPNSPGQDSSEDLPVIQGQRKRVRTSEEGYRPSTGRKRASATQGSPLNPQNNRIASLSPSMAHRRRAAMENAFEHNPMYDEGMEIFQDPLTAKSAMETRILELQRRTREIGPAPLPPKSPPQTPPTALRPLTPISSPSPNPKTPQSTGVRQSLDANVASIQRRGHNSLDTRRSPTPGGLGSPVAPHVRSMSPLVPKDVQASSPEPLRRVETVPTGPSPSPSKETKAHGRTSIGHLISEMTRRGKGKEKEVDAEDILHFNQSVASIRASPLANDPAVLQRVSTVADQLGRRYGLVYRALKAGEPPPNPLAVIRWRKSLLGHATSTTRPSRGPPHVRKHFDLPPIIDEELSAESMGHHLYSQEEIESLAWVRSLNTLHLQEVASEYGSKPGLPEVMDWHLTAGVVEGYVIAAKREREEEARKQFGVLRESPASSDTSFFHGLESLEHHPTTRIVDPRYGAALSPKSSTSASSQARNPSGHSSFRFPFSSPKAAADALSVSSSSQKSADMRQTSQPHSGAEDLQSPRSDGTAIVVNTPDLRKVTPSSIDTSAAAGSLAGVSRRSSLDFGFTSDEPAAGGKAGRRRLRNSLPVIIDSSRNSLSQFLSPITGASSSPFTRSPIARMHTSPHFKPSPLTSKDPETEKGGDGHLGAPQSDDGESGRSSLSDNMRGPIVSTSDDGRHSFTALEKMKQRMMGRTAGQPALSELVESERDNLDPSRSSSVAQLVRPRVVSPDGVDISSSEDDFSFKRNLANSRAGRKMAQSWNALTKRDQKSNLYDERDEHLGATGSGDPTDARPKALFRLDTDATERPGTRSDHLLRTGKRRSLVRMRPVTQEEEEIRLAKKRQLELKERTAYEQRLSLVLESRRQSEAVNHILQIALRAVSDYTTRQAALLDSLGVTLHPHISASIFDTLEPIRSSDEPGWRGIEDDLNESYRRHALLDDYLAGLETESLAHNQPDETFLQDIMDVIPAIVGQINLVEAEGQRLEEEIGQVEELQSELQQAIDKEEAKVIATVEMIEAGYPELAKNDALANKLKLDNATQLFPSEWPSWLKDALYIASPFVDWLANVILLIYSSWKTKVPQPMRNMAWMTFYVGFNGLQAGFAALVLLYHSQYRTPVLMATFVIVLSFVYRNVLYLLFGAAFTSSSTVQVSSTS